MSITAKLSTLKTRCDGIASIRTVVKRKRDFNESELPAVAIYRGTSQVDEQISGSKSRLTVPFVVDYHKESSTDDPATEAETMVDAVLAVIEVDEWGDCDLFSHSGDSVTLPPDDGGVISIQVLFEAEVIRQYGGGA